MMDWISNEINSGPMSQATIAAMLAKVNELQRGYMGYNGYKYIIEKIGCLMIVFLSLPKRSNTPHGRLVQN